MPDFIELLEARPDWAVAVKPFGCLSEDAAPRGPQDDGEEGMPSLLRRELDRRGLPYEDVFPVHRLDRTTEGLMVYALTKKGASVLSAAAADGRIAKIYTAYITAAPDLPEAGEMRDFLYFDRRRDKSFVVNAVNAANGDRRGAKEAVLRYEITGRSVPWKGTTVARAKVELLTGRTHQIRVQFGSRRSPLLGDGKYGSRVNRKGPSLFSTELAFPWEGETVRFRRDAELI